MFEKSPWLAHYGDIPHTIRIPSNNVYEMIRDSALRYPDLAACSFLGRRISYKSLLGDIDRLADGLIRHGLTNDDVVTICLPNCPQAVTAFYAVNKTGATSSLIHPLLPPPEIEHTLNESMSCWIVTLNLLLGNFIHVFGRTNVKAILITGIEDALGPVKRAVFKIAKAKKRFQQPEQGTRILKWRRLTRRKAPGTVAPSTHWPDERACILYTGGTGGSPLGVVLSSENINASGLAIASQGPIEPGDAMLVMLPMFHAFGLGCIHAFLASGGTCILSPRFNPKTDARLLGKEKPEYMAGVPTIYEALLREKAIRRVSFRNLVAAYSGGDKLPFRIKQMFDALVAENGGEAGILEGYGLTESMGASIVTPRHKQKEGSVGVPLPGITAKVINAATLEEARAGTEGELCISGAVIMKEYLGDPVATASALKRHPDGLLWLHTGDICSMDSDGFIYYRYRLKRLIKVCGENVSPALVEETLNAHPHVLLSCAIGIPDEHSMQRIKAFVILQKGIEPSEEKKLELVSLCASRLSKLSVPKEIEFRQSLPLTRLGKVSYTELEKENRQAGDRG